MTGYSEEIGEGAGQGHNANLPMARGSGDATFHEAFDAAFLPLLHAFAPDYVLLQVGADAHFSDRLAHLSLTTHGWLGLVERVVGLGKPIIALGGGGYNLPTVARLWALLFGALSGQTFPDTLPAADAVAWGVSRLHDPKLLAVSGTDDDIRRQATASVEAIQRLVFPVHGLPRE